KNSLNRLIRCVCGKKIGPDPRNFNQRVSLGRNDLLIRTFLSFALSFFTAPQAGRLSAKYGAMKVLRVLFLIMAFGMLLTLTSNVVTFIVGAVIFTGCFFGCHSIGLSWVSKNATHARGQAVALYLFFYYMGGSVIGFINGFVFHSMGWQGMTGFILALLGVGVVVATYLASGNKQILVPAQSAE
ncbi:MFS transporter, partial [Enterobacter roggenkampii]|uniref:MFS transporter n=1 Tax=Enterobacter roggenkampii TaxID=1812935 RepID=UPI0032AF2D1A